MAGLKGIHWLAPTIMTSTLFAALAFTLGHHFFYHSLSGNKVASGSYNIAGKTLSKQQFNTAVGTAFAFLIRLLLGIANSAAYVQLFWLSARYARTPTINELDWADTVVSNVFKLFYVHRGWKFPTLALAALILWCTPIATIFPPATLVVDNVQQNASTLLQVPNLDFNTFAYSADMYPGYLNDRQIWEYRGTSQPIQNLAFAVAASGRGLVPNFYPASPTDSANATWVSQDLFTPAIKCRDVIGEERGNIWRNIYNSYNWTTAGAPVFLSWVPWSEHDSVLAGFNVTAGRLNHQDRNLPYYFNGTGIRGPSGSPVSTDGPASFFVAVMPGAQNITIARNDEGIVTVTPQDTFRPDDSPVVLSQGCQFVEMGNFNQSLTLDCGAGTSLTPATIFSNASLSRCDLMNVSTSIGFDYSRITTPVQLLAFDNTGDSYVNGSQYFLGPSELTGYANATQLADQTCVPFIADPLAIVGDAFASSQRNASTKEPLRNSCEFDPASLRLLSYQSIMAAFQQTFLGSIDSNRNVQTKIVDTVFMETNELNWLRPYIVNKGINAQFTLSKFFDILPAAEKYRATAAPSIVADQGWLIPAMGDAFERLVLSLFSEPYFYPNYSSVFAPPRLTSVTTQEFENIYTYDAFTLWTAYGLALLFTTLVVISGWVAIFLNKCSYSNDFSTFVRVGRLAEISIEVRREDGSGCDPLPKYLEKARMNIGELNQARIQAGSAAGVPAKSAPEAAPLVSGSDDSSQQADEAQDAIPERSDVLHPLDDSSNHDGRAPEAQLGPQLPIAQQVSGVQPNHTIPRRAVSQRP